MQVTLIHFIPQNIESNSETEKQLLTARKTVKFPIQCKNMNFSLKNTSFHANLKKKKM